MAIYNAKTIPYKQPGSGAFGYGVTRNNAIPRFEKLFQDFKVGGNAGGGNKDIYNAALAYIGNAGKRGALDLTAWNKLASALKTGNFQGVNSKIALNTLDYALRETGRKQQTKRSFFDSPLGKLVQVGGTVAGAALGGPVGGALAGGGLGAASGGLKGGLLGAVGGYFTPNILSKLKLPSNIFNVSNPLAGGFRQLSGALGMGPVTDLNAFYPAAAVTRGGAGALAGLGSTAARAAGGVLSNRGTTQGGSGGTNVAGMTLPQILAGGASALLGLNSSGVGNYNDLVRQIQGLTAANQFSPYDIRTPLGTTGLRGNTVQTALTPAGNQQFALFNNLINRTGQAAGNLDPRGLSREFFNMMDTLESDREQRGFQDFESQIFNRSGITTGSAMASADFAGRLADARQARQIQAINSARDYQTGLFEDFMNLVGGRQNAITGLLDPMKASFDFGFNRAQSNADELQLMAQALAGQTAVRTSRDTNTNAVLRDLLDFGIDFLL